MGQGTDVHVVGGGSFIIDDKFFEMGSFDVEVEPKKSLSNGEYSTVGSTMYLYSKSTVF